MKRPSQELDTDEEDNTPLAQRYKPKPRLPCPDGQLITKALQQSGQAKPSAGVRSFKPVAASVKPASGTISLSLTDPDLLDCPICANPLNLVIYQCQNGHIACSDCRIGVKRKCPTCSEQITFNRCRIMEKMIEAMRFECENKIYGCKETFIYPEKVKHEKICPNTACYCPIPSCGFIDSCKSLYRHFSSDHKRSTILFTYNTTFSFGVEKSQKYVIVQEQNEGVIFVLKQSVKEMGRAYSIDCIGPPSSERTYTFDLRVRYKDTSFSLESVPEVHAKWDHGTPSKNVFTIPSATLEKCGKVYVQICIKKLNLPIVLVDSQ